MRSGELNRPGDGAPSWGKTAAEERESERADAVQDRAFFLLAENHAACPECEEAVFDTRAHLATCELLRARAEAEVDRG